MQGPAAVAEGPVESLIINKNSSSSSSSSNNSNTNDTPTGLSKEDSSSHAKGNIGEVLRRPRSSHSASSSSKSCSRSGSGVIMPGSSVGSADAGQVSWEIASNSFRGESDWGYFVDMTPASVGSNFIEEVGRDTGSGTGCVALHARVACYIKSG